MEFARSTKNCPPSSLRSDEHWYMNLKIIKVTYLHHMEFRQIINNLKRMHYTATVAKTQKTVDFTKMEKLVYLDVIFTLHVHVI